MVAGLGKFGGIELGFASDIELLLVYESAGQTTGAQSISNAEFFERMVRAVAAGIRAPQDGIFHVDLRMRPYGQAGPAAVRFPDFVEYYRLGGPAWPYERQSLVRLRAIAGDAGFGYTVCSAAREAIYLPQRFDFAAMQAMRERQIRQLVRAWHDSCQAGRRRTCGLRIRRSITAVAAWTSVSCAAANQHA
jgi:glutamate-ammonia-ligase adenylyltransferase